MGSATCGPHSLSIAGGEQAIVLGVISDPEPQDAVIGIYSERAMMKSDAARPESSNPLQIQRWMVRIGFEKLIFLVC
ncbi:MAG TPA: hypothetical protein VMT64_08100 [Candidatus Binataceae bacterium]|nr:hypothetical protein [Candidatus Binataceae bacterium]